SLGGAHVLHQDDPNETLWLPFEHDDEQPSRQRGSERRVVSALRPSKQRPNREDLLRFLRLDPLAERHVEDIAIVPFELLQPHTTTSTALLCITLPPGQPGAGRTAGDARRRTGRSQAMCRAGADAASSSRDREGPLHSVNRIVTRFPARSA